MIINGREEKIRASGKYSGVNLAMSDVSTQSQYRAILLEGMIKKERKGRKKAKDQPPKVQW